MTWFAFFRERSATLSSNGPNRSRVALGEPICWTNMSYSAKILDDSIVAPFVVSLVQIHPSPSSVSRNLFQQQAISASNWWRHRADLKRLTPAWPTVDR